MVSVTRRTERPSARDTGTNGIHSPVGQFRNIGYSYCSRHSTSPICHTTHVQTAAISKRQLRNVIVIVQ